MKVLAIVSAGINTGSGHLFRTLSFINNLDIKTKNISLIIDTKNFNSVLQKKKINFLNLQITEREKIIRFIIIKKPDLIILDSYKINYKFELNLKRNFNNTLLIDDNADRKHSVNFYLNLNWTSARLKEKIKKNITAKQFFLGPEYINNTILNQKITKKKNDVLIFFGSTNQHNILKKTINVISKSKFDKYNFKIIIGKFEKINKKNLFKKNIKFFNYLSEKKFHKMLGKFTLAIGAGGVSLTDRLKHKIINLVIITANNQTNNVYQLKKLNLVDFAGLAKNISKKQLYLKINNFLYNYENQNYIYSNLKMIKFGTKNSNLLKILKKF